MIDDKDAAARLFAHVQRVGELNGALNDVRRMIDAALAANLIAPRAGQSILAAIERVLPRLHHQTFDPRDDDAMKPPKP